MSAEKQPNIPLVIACLDVPYIEQAEEIAIKLNHFDAETIGYKIPEALLPDYDKLSKTLRKQNENRYIIADVRAHDKVEKTGHTVRAYIGRIIMPNAITISPVVEQGYGDKFDNDVVEPARQFGLQLIGYAEHQPLSTDHDFEHLARIEATRYLTACNRGFTAFEVSDSLRPYFEPEILHTGRAIRIPTVASSFKTPEDSNLKDVVARAYSEYTTAVYLGHAIVEAENPAELIEDILTKKQELQN